MKSGAKAPTKSQAQKELEKAISLFRELLSRFQSGKI